MYESIRPSKRSERDERCICSCALTGTRPSRGAMPRVDPRASRSPDDNPNVRMTIGEECSSLSQSLCIGVVQGPSS